MGGKKNQIIPKKKVLKLVGCSVGGVGEGMVMCWHAHNRDKCRMQNKTFSNLGTAIKITLQIARLRVPKW